MNLNTSKALPQAEAARRGNLDALGNLLRDLIGSLAGKMAPGPGITAGTGTVYKTSVTRTGEIIKTEILLDLTGLDSSGTAGDIIGDAAGGAAHLGQITKERNGTIFAGTIRCLEVPTGGDPDVDFYAATEATGVFDGAVSSLAETQLINTGDWTLEEDTLTSLPADGQYLYAAAGATDDATYTAGKFLITLYGYEG